MSKKMAYIGLMYTYFKKRHSNNLLSFGHEACKLSTELSNLEPEMEKQALHYHMDNL